MFVKKKYEASNPFKITDVKCDQKWLAEAGNDGLVVSCLINGVSCKFPFKGARWSNVMVGALGIDCEDALFPRSGSFWPEHVRIASEGGGNYYYPLCINDDVVKSQPKENQKDFRFTGQLYSTAPIAKAFKTKLLELYNKGYLTQKFLEHVGAAEAPTEEARKGKVDWYDLAYWVSKANEPEYGDMSITLKEIADHAHTTVDDVKAHAYDIMKTMRGIDCIDDVYWRGEADSPITFTKKKMWYEDRVANEATLMIRGGKATGLLEVVDRIAKAKNQARAQDMQGIFSHYMALSNVLNNTDGITREQVPGKPYYIYSVDDFLHSYYKDACRELGRGYYELDGKYVPGKKDSEPQTPQTPPAPAKQATGTVMPFEQCFFAEMILDAEDYSGPRECSWIDPKNLNHVLSVYVDKNDEETPLSRKMGDLKQMYDRLKEKCLADGKAKIARVGYDYDEIDPASVPGLVHYRDVWPKGGRGARVQDETSLWMCVAPSRDKVKFDDNEWNSRPVIDV